MSKLNGKSGVAAAASLKAACLDSVDNARSVAQAADDGRRVIGANRKYGSAKEAAEAKIQAAKDRREAAAAEKKAGK